MAGYVWIPVQKAQVADTDAMNALGAAVTSHDASVTTLLGRGFGVIARAKRSAGKSGITTESGLVRLDGVSLTAGRTYHVDTGEGGFTSTANEQLQGLLQFHVNATGAAATTSDPVFGPSRPQTQPGSGNGSAQSSFFIYAGASATYSFLLTATKIVGTGTVSVTGPDGAGPEIVVTDLGLTPTQTGLDQ